MASLGVLGVLFGTVRAVRAVHDFTLSLVESVVRGKGWGVDLVRGSRMDGVGNLRERSLS